MRVFVENLPDGISAEQLRREFQRAGKCSVELKVKHTQGTEAYVDYLDIVNASEAIKMFHGKDFAGNKVSVSKVFDCVVNLSQKRGRDLPQTISLTSGSKIISLGGEKKTEINLNGKVCFGEKPEVKTQLLEKTELSGSKEKLEANEEPSKVRKMEEEVKIQKKIEETPLVKTESLGKQVEQKETKTVQVTKEVSKDVKVIKIEVKPKTKEVVTNVKETKIEVKPETKEDPHTIEIEGSKFLKTSDDSKLHCILCNKELTKKSVTTHIKSKAHKSFQ